MPNQKDLRKQIRNVLQAEYPSILTADIAAAIEARVVATVTARLEKIAKDVEDTLKSINDRSKDTMGYLVRQASTVHHTPPTETAIQAPTGGADDSTR